MFCNRKNKQNESNMCAIEHARLQIKTKIDSGFEGMC